MLRIPFDPTPSADQTFQVLVPEKVVLNLRLVWNIRASAWDVTIGNGRNELGMLRLIPSFPLLAEHHAISPIDGDIIALPLSGTAEPMTSYKSLGREWGLFYLSPEDVSAWRVANGLG